MKSLEQLSIQLPYPDLPNGPFYLPEMEIYQAPVDGEVTVSARKLPWLWIGIGVLGLAIIASRR